MKMTCASSRSCAAASGGRFCRTVVLLSLAALFAAGAQASTRSYRFTDLGTLGGLNSIAYSINDAGNIVGSSNIAGDAAMHATAWSGTTARDLGTLGGSDSYAYAINNAGQIAGASELTGNVATHAVFWGGSAPIDLGTLGGTNSYAYGINDAGRIVGSSSVAGSGSAHATLWNGARATDLGAVPGSVGSYARSINDAGQIAGGSVFGGAGTFANRATLWNRSTPTAVDSLGGESVATGINAMGQAVGFGYLPNNTNSRALLWDHGSMTALENLGGNSSFAAGINNAGQVVGWSFTIDPEIGRHAALWNGTAVTDLNRYLDPDMASAGWYLYDAVSINDSGWIVGTARNDITRESHAYLLSVTEMPEPASYAMMLAGLAASALAARRRRGISFAPRPSLSTEHQAILRVVPRGLLAFSCAPMEPFR